MQDLLDYAREYNAYERWADTTEALESLLDPVRREWQATGVLPTWAGIDTLRALLFFEYRADYFAGGSDFGAERIRTVVAALRRKAGWLEP